MDFEAALTIELKTIPDVQNRVYPLDAPKKTANPYITYKSSEGKRTNTITNGYLSDRSVRGEINVIAPRYSIAKRITSQVIELIAGMNLREIGDAGPYINEMTYEEPVELFEPAISSYRCVIEFRTYY